MSDDAPFRIQRTGAVLELTLARGKANAIDAATSRALGAAFASFRDDDVLRVAILASGNTKFFAAGRDLHAAAADGPPLVFAAIKEVARESEGVTFADALARIAARGYPTVARLYASADQVEGARAFAGKRPPVWQGR